MVPALQIEFSEEAAEVFAEFVDRMRDSLAEVPGTEQFDPDTGALLPGTGDRYPNLLVAPALEPSEVLMRRARAVAVINSTVGTQAALLGIPVLTFHDRYTARLMPHVWYANSYQATRQALREIRDGKGPDSRGRRLGAQAYLNAFARFEFPITNSVLLGGGRMKSAMQGEEFDAMYEALVRSLQWRRANHAAVIARGAI